VLERVKKSSFYLAREVMATKCVMRDVKTVLKRDMGVTDATKKELVDLCNAALRVNVEKITDISAFAIAKEKEVAGLLAEMVSKRAEIGFSSHGKLRI
jgi:xanthine/CO dehydrogenase XdhC/CoxF family maturation factor